MGIILKYQNGDIIKHDNFNPNLDPLNNLQEAEKYKKQRADYKKDNSPYRQVLNAIIAEKGGYPEDYEKLMDTIAYHESKYLVKDKISGKSNYTYMDPSAKQVNGGPGRGMFMFEYGVDKGGITAVRRTVAYMKQNNLEIPRWLHEAGQKNSLDASKLNEEQQKTLFLCTYRMHEKANLGNVVHGKQTISDFWGRYHQTQNDTNKLKNFLDDEKSFQNYSKKNKY